ncbi:AAA family ATPase [uncultured Methanobrevibacter sp.]|uniref:AAA family ATPase n=1 Tax=uncultured Methanobrevibacter sp. TaxID=253161 RepID=UPI0025FAB6B5|nr:AAA family ATPase [uncultured Methanobrevibacter sp.]
MRIEEIQFKNFRKYVDTSINFNNENNNDIHVVIAENGAGKTTFLNAMTWCLYNEEPKIKDQDDALPTLNTEVSNNSDNDFEKASVRITVAGDGLKLIYKRSDIFKIHSIHSDYYKNNGKREEWIDQEFTVTEIEGSQSNVCRDIGECELLVSSFIPEAIKEFFFFDGEQLDNYFLMSTAIKDQVFTLSHIFVLDEMEERLNEKLKYLRKQGNPNSDADSKLKEYNEQSEFLKSEKDRYENLKDSYKSLENELKSLVNNLGSVPSIKDVEKKRNAKIIQKNKNNEKISSKEKSLNDLIIKESPKILAKHAFIKALNLIEENKDDSYVYPIDEDILEDSLHDHSCKVCDRIFDDELMSYIKKKKAKLYLISPEDKILNDNKKFFNRFKNIQESYIKSEKELMEDISDLDNAVKTLEREIKEFYHTIKVNEHLKDSIDRRDELLEVLPEKNTELNNLNENNKKLQRCIEKLHEEYLNLLEEEEEYREISAKIKLCTDALVVIKNVKEDMMAETRKIIQEVTKEMFFGLIRKSKTYGEIEINENYEVKLFDEDGRPSKSSASASEVELLALAFILAIHSVSGFDSPLVVDTLLARTGGEQRLNVAKSCLNVSEEKQLLLFLLEEEYSEPVKQLYKQKHVNEYSLRESESEKQIIIEGK